MSVLITLLALAGAITFYLFKRIFNFWTNLGVPQFPTEFPHGNIKGLGKDYHVSKFLVKYYQKIKSSNALYGGLYFFVQPVLMVVDLDLVKTIFIKDFNVFPNRGIYNNEKDDPVSAHLVNLENDAWRNLRQKLSPTFTSGKIKMMLGTVDEVAERLLKNIDKQIDQTGQLEVKDTLARFTTDVIGSVAFGIECNSLEDKNSKFYEMGTKLFNSPQGGFGVVRRILQSYFRDLSRKLHLKNLPDDMSDFYLGITRQTVEYREKNPQVNRQDFMNLLVQMKKEKLVTVEQIAGQSFIFFLGKFEF